MKTSLKHLPKQKKDELKTIVRMIREEFDVEMIKVGRVASLSVTNVEDQFTTDEDTE